MEHLLGSETDEKSANGSGAMKASPNLAATWDAQLERDSDAM
jgi:hypothetical protein